MYSSLRRIQLYGMCSMYEAWNVLQTLVPSLLTSTRLTSSKGLLSTPHHSNTVTVAGSVIHYSFCDANLSLSSRNILSNLIVSSRFACPRDVFCLGNVRPDTSNCPHGDFRNCSCESFARIVFQPFPHNVHMAIGCLPRRVQ